MERLESRLERAKYEGNGHLLIAAIPVLAGFNTLQQLALAAVPDSRSEPGRGMTTSTRLASTARRQASFSGGHIMVVKIAPTTKATRPASSRMPSCISPTALSKESS